MKYHPVWRRLKVGAATRALWLKCPEWLRKAFNVLASTAKHIAELTAAHVLARLILGGAH